jgi:hypothetical protein
MDPTAGPLEIMDSVISKLVDFLSEYTMAGSWGTNMEILRKELTRLRSCYRNLAGAPSWYILAVCKSTELSTEVITELFYDAEKIVDFYVENDEFDADDLIALEKIARRAKNKFPGYTFEEEATLTSLLAGIKLPPVPKSKIIFKPSALPKVSGWSVFSKLRELLKVNCNIPTTTKVELKSLLIQLGYLRKGLFMLRGDAPFNQLRGPDSVWLCQTSKLFCEASNLVDTLLVPAECNDSEAAANPEVSGTSGDSSNPPLQIRHVEIKKMTERASLHAHLLGLRKGSGLRAEYKNKQEEDLVGIDGPRDALIKMLAEEDVMPEKNMKGVIIVGAEGSGKTTLARVMYHHLKLQFDCAAFVTASILSEASQLAFFKEMVSQLDMENHINFDKISYGGEGYIEQIAEFLQNKR